MEDRLQKLLGLDGIPNLDCMAYDDLIAFSNATARSVSESDRLDLAFLMYPEEEDTERALEVLHMLHTYSTNCAQAVRHRSKGDVDQATRFESRCEMIYRDLPPYARW